MQLYTQDTCSYIICLRAEACEDSYFTRILVKINLKKGVFTHLKGTCANLLEFFWSTNMTTFTLCENALLQLSELR